MNLFVLKKEKQVRFISSPFGLNNSDLYINFLSCEPIFLSTVRTETLTIPILGCFLSIIHDGR